VDLALGPVGEQKATPPPRLGARAQGPGLLGPAPAVPHAHLHSSRTDDLDESVFHALVGKKKWMSFVQKRRPNLFFPNREP